MKKVACLALPSVVPNRGRDVGGEGVVGDVSMNWDELLGLFQSHASLNVRREAACDMALQHPKLAWPVLQEAAFVEPLAMILPALQMYPARKAGSFLQRLLLERGGSTDDQLAILQAMSEIPAIPELLELADDPFTPPVLQEECGHWLAQFPQPETVGYFLRELQSPRLTRRNRAIRVLGDWRVEQAVPSLAAILQRQVRTNLFLPVVSALGHIASTQALRALQRFMLNQEPELMLLCASILAQIPVAELVGPMEDCLPFLEGDDLVQMEECIQLHEQIMLEQRDSELESMREAWEEQLFA